MNRDQLLDTEQQKIKGIRGREEMINSGNIKGKDGSVTTYNPIHPHEEEQRIKGSVLGGDNIERETRDRDLIPTKMSTSRTPINASSPTFPDQEQKPKAGALRQGEDDHKRNDHVVSKESPKTINGRREDMSSTVEWGEGNIAPNQRGRQPESSHVKQKAPHDQIDPSKEEQINNFPGQENSTDKNDYATSNSLQYSSVPNYIPVGIPIAENGVGPSGMDHDRSLKLENKFQYAGDREGVPPPLNLNVLIQPPTSNEKKNGKIEVDINVSICCRCSIL